ncbi:type II toxin-antitoxin system RelE/ParE family toxin [Burkholderiaceae bacterium DAT-1]|nr:type II toxin-antitoxin system RelE/ParE family toxin [Burkholderiaceae bacterium DAT-1]
MPRLIVTQGAVNGLERCRRFLQVKSREAAKRAAAVIAQHLSLLESSPDIGRPLSDYLELRELIIAFGDSGYVALYRYEAVEDAVYILAFRHQKETGYA